MAKSPQIEMRTDMELFNIEPIKETDKTCRTCVHRQRWECNSKVFQYCGIWRDNRTFNKLKKIKCKNKACAMYKEETK